MLREFLKETKVQEENKSRRRLLRGKRKKRIIKQQTKEGDTYVSSLMLQPEMNTGHCLPWIEILFITN